MNEIQYIKCLTYKECCGNYVKNIISENGKEYLFVENDTYWCYWNAITELVDREIGPAIFYKYILINQYGWCANGVLFKGCQSQKEFEKLKKMQVFL